MHKHFHGMATDIFPYPANVSKVVDAYLAYSPIDINVHFCNDAKKIRKMMQKYLVINSIKGCWMIQWEQYHAGIIING